MAAIVWLAFIVFPLANAFGKKGTALEQILVIAGAAVFVACYVILVVYWRGHPRTPMPLLLFAVMLAVSAALTIWQASGWGFLFTYCAACAALLTAAGFWAVVVCAVLAGACSAVGGADGGTVVGFVASSASVGLLMLVMRDLRVRNMELNQARASLRIRPSPRSAGGSPAISTTSSAAGIETDIVQSRVALDPAVEAVLAWAIREGATNVIRHGGARHCKFKITASLTDAASRWSTMDARSRSTGTAPAVGAVAALALALPAVGAVAALALALPAVGAVAALALALPAVGAVAALALALPAVGAVAALALALPAVGAVAALALGWRWRWGRWRRPSRHRRPWTRRTRRARAPVERHRRGGHHDGRRLPRCRHRPGSAPVTRVLPA